MSAGIPGLGLGGLFFIVSALLAPVPELVRTLRGRSSRAAWARVGRQFLLAILMIVAIDAMLRLAYVLLLVTGLGDAPEPDAVTVLPLVPIAITASVLALVLAGAKGLELAARARAGALTPAFSVELRPRAQVLSGAGALAAIWLALLLFGASGLSPLSQIGPPGTPSGPDDARAEGAADAIARAGGAGHVSEAPDAPPVVNGASQAQREGHGGNAPGGGGQSPKDGADTDAGSAVDAGPLANGAEANVDPATGHGEADRAIQPGAPPVQPPPADVPGDPGPVAPPAEEPGPHEAIGSPPPHARGAPSHAPPDAADERASRAGPPEKAPAGGGPPRL